MPYAAVNGARLWYEDTGGEGTAVALIHGSAGSSECWSQQVPAFTAAGFRVVTYDLRGFGRSRASDAKDKEGSIAGDLEQLRDALSLPSFFLVAQAYGGFGAFEFALANSDRVKALVVSTSFGGLTDPEFTALRARHVPSTVAALPVQERELGATYRATNPDGVQRFLAMERGSYRAADERQQLREPLTLNRLESMRVPTLLIAGSEDVLAPPPVMRVLADHIPGCEFQVIANAGHCAYWEQPRVWNGIVLDFLRRQVS